MGVPGDAGLVMLSGSSAGAGKSTVMLALADRCSAYGRVLTVSEDDVWGKRELGTDPVDRTAASPLFFDLLHRDAPEDVSPAAVVGAFEQLRREAMDGRAMWLQDWSWPELLSMLGWSPELRQETSHVLHELSAALAPAMVIYLQLDPQDALDRAVRERGATWFNRYAGRRPDEPVTRTALRQVADMKRQAEQERRAALAGWPVALVDGSGDRADVIDAAWRVVREHREITVPTADRPPS